jgi:glycosyltransferase involved in cell wall biosynthesis
VNGASGFEYFNEDLKVPARKLTNQYLVPLQNREVESAAPPRTTDVLFIGRLIERKGIRAFVEAAKDMGELTVEVLGSGELEDEVKALAAGSRVEFSGEVTPSEVACALARSRCLVVPSTDEPWGLVVQEALQANVPVVVGADMGCVADLVIDGVNGVILGRIEPAEILQGVERALALGESQLATCNATILSEWCLSSHVESYVGAISRRL